MPCEVNMFPVVLNTLHAFYSTAIIINANIVEGRTKHCSSKFADFKVAKTHQGYLSPGKCNMLLLPFIYLETFCEPFMKYCTSYSSTRIACVTMAV